MPTLDIFNNQAFASVELSEAMNVVPNRYGRIGELGIFTERGVSTTSVSVEINNGVLNLLPTGKRGAPASQGTSGKRKLKSFEIPHIPHEDVVTAGEVQNVRAFGSETELQTVMGTVNDKLITMSAKHDITLEWFRAGALRGDVLDDTGTSIINWFTEFGVAEKVVDFNLDSADTDVDAKVREVLRHIETNLMGDTMSSVRALCSPEFWDAFTGHAKVREAYRFQQGQNLMRDDMRKGFNFQGVTWEEYNGLAVDKEGTPRRFIPAGDVRFAPLGTFQTFRTFFAPADFMETVNTKGLRLYAKMERIKFDRGMELHTQSNPLPICLRPAVLVRGHA